MRVFTNLPSWHLDPEKYKYGRETGDEFVNAEEARNTFISSQNLPLCMKIFSDYYNEAKRKTPASLQALANLIPETEAGDKLCRVLFNCTGKELHDNPQRDAIFIAAEGKEALEAQQQALIEVLHVNTDPIPFVIQSELKVIRAQNTIKKSILEVRAVATTDTVDEQVKLEEIDAGISHLGKHLIQEMNRLGIIIDGAHSSMKTILDSIELSKLPVIVSHACAYGINPIPRNIRDEQLQAIAKSGGLIGINGIGLLLGDKSASVKKYVDHIDYIVNLVGIPYVGIGLDNFYFGDKFSEFMKNQPITNPSEYGKMADSSMFTCIKPVQIIDIVEELLQRQYSTQDIKAILGENFLRVIEEHQNVKNIQ